MSAWRTPRSASWLANFSKPCPLPALDKEATVVVFCHHGIRSAQVAAWLLDQGWQSVYNLAGGIDAYARQVDPSIGFY
jgi:rhodanese-related sulfurtransferase